MSTQKGKNKGKIARRSTESILAEVFLCKKLGWQLGFISGGHNAYNTTEFLKLLRQINIVAEEKVWINIGPVSKPELRKFMPYIKGVVGSIETINPVIHLSVCPSKPVKPFEEMFQNAKELGLKNAMTIIVGLGEKISDFEILRQFIVRNSISKIHFYGLNPQKGTAFEKASPPAKEYQAEWISRTRKAFPGIDIQCGIWKDRPEYISALLKAGANSISKFPAIKKFGSEEAKRIELEAKKAGRKFLGTLTKKTKISLDEIDNYKLPIEIKEKVKEKLKQYMKRLKV